VNWYAAMAYARWYTEAHGDDRYRFRLPSVLEWEKLSRGTDGRLYPWGNTLVPDPRRTREEQTLVPVDAQPDRRSPYGLFQTFGNVSEWCLDATDPTALHRRLMGPSASSLADLMLLRLGGARPAHQRPAEAGLRLVAEVLDDGG